MSYKIFVFDLDFTLWDAGGTWCDATNPPYFWENEKLFDQSRRWIHLYPDVLPILNELKDKGKLIVAASRTFEPNWAQDLLYLFDIDKFFNLKEIYPDSKVIHFKKIQQFFELPFSEMVFFDDEYRNIEAVSRLGVKAELVRKGITFNHLKDYL